MNGRTSTNSSFRGIVLAAAMLLVSLTASAAQSSSKTPSSPNNDAAALSQTGDFYQQRLRNGSRAFDLKDFPTAVAELRLACFGMLETPIDLTDCLMRLALAQGAAEDAELIKTIDRLEVLENQFGTVSSGRVGSALRMQLALLLEPRAEALRLSAGSILRRPASVTAQEPETSEDGPLLNRQELEQRMASEPENAKWPLDLAAMIVEREPARAAQLANVALELDSTLIEARCLRGLSRSRLSGMCRTALVDLETCGRAQLDLTHARATLSCQQSLRRWSAAEVLVASLPDSLRADPQVAEITTQVEARAVPEPPVQLLPETSKTKIAVAATPVERQPREQASPATATGATGTQVQQPFASGLPSLAAATLERASSILREARKLSELEQALALARSVADEHPESNFAQQLVGEIAFKSSRYGTAVRYFERGMPFESERSDLKFYRAISLYEVGLPDAAARALRNCIDQVAPSPWVNEIREQILGSGDQA